VRKIFAAWSLAAVLFAPSLVTTDDFNRGSTVTLCTGNWTCIDGSSFVVTNTAAEPDNGSQGNFAYYSGASFTDDHYSQVKWSSSGATNGVGPAVRVSATDDGYMYQVHDTSIYRFDDVSAGTYTMIKACTDSPSVGDTLKLEISGTTLTVSRNGTPVSGCTITDATYASGEPGVYGSVSSGMQFDDWEGGDVGGGGGATINPAKINTPIRGGGLLGLVKDFLHVR
jgi:hypothetical protein